MITTSEALCQYLVTAIEEAIESPIKIKKEFTYRASDNNLYTLATRYRDISVVLSVTGDRPVMNDLQEVIDNFVDQIDKHVAFRKAYADEDPHRQQLLSEIESALTETFKTRRLELFKRLSPSDQNDFDIRLFSEGGHSFNFRDTDKVTLSPTKRDLLYAGKLESYVAELNGMFDAYEPLQYENAKVIEDIIGKRIMDCWHSEDEFQLLFNDGKVLRLWHYQDCCETVELTDIDGDIGDLIGGTCNEAEVVNSGEFEAQHKTMQWTYYKFGTEKGSISLRWYGASNGYYSVDVNHEIVQANKGRVQAAGNKLYQNTDGEGKFVIDLRQHIQKLLDRLGSVQGEYDPHQHVDVVGLLEGTRYVRHGKYNCSITVDEALNLRVGYVPNNTEDVARLLDLAKALFNDIGDRVEHTLRNNVHRTVKLETLINEYNIRIKEVSRILAVQYADYEIHNALSEVSFANDTMCLKEGVMHWGPKRDLYTLEELQTIFQKGVEDLLTTDHSLENKFEPDGFCARDMEVLSYSLESDKLLLTVRDGERIRVGAISSRYTDRVGNPTVVKGDLDSLVGKTVTRYDTYQLDTDQRESGRVYARIKTDDTEVILMFVFLTGLAGGLVGLWTHFIDD